MYPKTSLQHVSNTKKNLWDFFHTMPPQRHMFYTLAPGLNSDATFLSEILNLYMQISQNESLKR